MKSNVKYIKAYGGYLGSFEIKKGVVPAICFGKLETNFDPKIPKWGNL